MNFELSDDRLTWYPAVVPGGVHESLLSAGVIEHPYFGDNEDDQPLSAQLTLDAVGFGIRVLSEVLEPRSLHAGIVRRCLDLVHEVADVRVEAILQSRIGDPSGAVEGAMRLGEAELVEVDARTEMFEGNA